MKGFTTKIKTPYTDIPVKDEGTFTTRYNRKEKRKVISGDNRAVGKKFASRLVK